MKYTIYKITNKVNGKIYIGKHQTKNLDDGYMGSGKLLKFAIEKYGMDNFIKEIIHIFDTEEEMNAKEAELVTEEFCLRENTYNICVGGQGGFSYINNNHDKFLTEKRLSSLRPDLGILGWKKKYESDPIFRQRQQKIAKNANKKSIEKNPLGTFYGKTHSEETKKRIGQKTSECMKGNGNSQYGTMWITNGIQNKKIKAIDTIPEGWYKGRKV